MGSKPAAMHVHQLHDEGPQLGDLPLQIVKRRLGWQLDTQGLQQLAASGDRLRSCARMAVEFHKDLLTNVV